MSEDVKTVIDYYQNSNEDIRMSENPLEFLRCKDIISRYLSNDNLSILDIGGAAGAFSFWLADQGHSVSLLDISPKHIEIAKLHEMENGIKLTSTAIGDARDLPYDMNSFDLVLLMGPLYHLINKSDRLVSMREAYRVLKPNGRIICEVISRFASMVDGFLFGLVNDPDFVPIMQRDIKTGIHKDTSQSKRYFTNGYFHLADELSNEIEEAGFKFEDTIAVTSFGCTIPEIEKKLADENYRKVLLETIKSVEKEPSLMGISSHYIGIGRKIH